jgi:hypothetical protein
MEVSFVQGIGLYSVSQTVVRSGPQAVSKKRNMAKIVSDTVRMKETPI